MTKVKPSNKVDCIRRNPLQEALFKCWKSNPSTNQSITSFALFPFLRKQQLPFPWPRLRRLLYRRADVLTANTTGVMDSLVPLFQARHLALLPNPLPMPVVPAAVGSAGDRQGFVTVARLVPQKGIDVLIRALAQTSAFRTFTVESLR